MQKLDFFIVTQSQEGYRQVMATINVLNQSDVDPRFSVRLEGDVELSEGRHRLTLVASKEAIKAMQPTEEHAYSLEEA